MTNPTCFIDRSFTQHLAEITSSARLSDVAEESLAVAKHAALDWFGVTLAGYDEPLAQILRATYATGGACSIVGGALRSSTRDAAMINGATSHALDYDDVNVVGHPTAAILPAILAVGEAHNKTSGEVLLAYICGYEVATLVAQQAMPSHYSRGFHSTATIGSIGAAAGVSKLLDLDAEMTANAIGLGATQAAGLKCMFGTMAKPLHAGKAAANGVLSAELAAAGFEARPDALEAPQGFFSTQTDITPEVNSSYRFGCNIRRNLFKFHAACYLTHSTMEALKAFAEQSDFDPEKIARLTIRVPNAHLNVCNIEKPASGLETKFSLRHCAALILYGYDTSSIETFNDELAVDKSLCDLRRRIDVRGDLAPGTHAEVVLEDESGAVHSTSHDVGIPASDLAAQERKLREKFSSLNSPRYEQRSDEIIDNILSFETVDQRNLYDLLDRSTVK